MPHNIRRRSIRLRGYDYSRRGAYFVTICAQDRDCLFGEIVNDKMQLNDAGQYARKCWMDIPAHFPDAQLDEFIIMPNHVHGIIVIRDSVGTNNHSPDHSPHHSPDNAKSLLRQSVALGY